VIAVAGPDLVGFTGFAQLLQRVLADGLQQPVSGAPIQVLPGHQRFVDQKREQVQHLMALQPVPGACRLSGL